MDTIDVFSNIILVNILTFNWANIFIYLIFSVKTFCVFCLTNNLILKTINLPIAPFPLPTTTIALVLFCLPFPLVTETFFTYWKLPKRFTFYKDWNNIYHKTIRITRLKLNLWWLHHQKKEFSQRMKITFIWRLWWTSISSGPRCTTPPSQGRI